MASQYFTLTQSVDLGSVDLTRRQGVSVTTPLRSLIDASPRLSEHQVGEVLTAGIQRAEFSYDEVQIRLAELGRRGRRGINKIRKVLLARPEAGRPLNTYEKISKRTIARAGFPPPIPQFPISVSGRTYFVDFAWPEFGLVMECDSMLAHSSPEQLQSDLRRQNQLVAAGWTVIRFTYWDIVDNPDRLIETLAQFLPREVG